MLEKIGDTKIWMCAFAATQANIRAEDDLACEKERQAAAESLMEIGKIQIAACVGDFAGVIKSEDTDGADDAAIVFCLNEK